MIPGHHILHQKKSQFLTDFGDHPTANIEAGAGWTVLGGTTQFDATVGISTPNLSGKRLVLSKTTTSVGRFFSWDRVPTVADVEVLALVHLLNIPATSDPTIGQVMVRMDPTDGDPYYIAVPAHYGGTTYILDLGRGDGAGGGLSLDMSVDLDWLTSVQYWIRLRVIGNTQKAKMWQYGTPEPAAWLCEATDTNVPSAGKVGFGSYWVPNSFAALFFSAALNGATAPFPGG